MNLIKLLLSLFVILIFHPGMNAQSVSPAELIRVPFTSHHHKEQKEYFLYLPAGYRSSPDRKWPVMMFLHGNGERGDGRKDLDWVLKEGVLYEAWIQKRDLPFIIIAPQLPMYGMDTIGYIRDRKVEQIPKRLEEGVPERPHEFLTPQKMRPESPVTFFRDETMSPAGWDREEDDLMDMIATTIREYHGDEDRVYLTGLSYGGEGTWYMASEHPKTWAAICPIVAWPHPDLIRPIAEHHIPLWSFAGGRDGSSLRYYYAGMNLLEELGHKDVRFTVEMDMGHDVWRRVYAGEDVYKWLLSKKRKQ